MAKEKKAKENTLKSQGTSDLSAATEKLTKYYEENGLDPKKDWSKDKKHGAVVSKLKKKIKIAKMKLEAGISDEKADKKPKVKPERVKTVKKQPSSYDYPDVDGKPMTPDLKKRYRSKMRALMKANMDVNVAKEKALASVMGTATKKADKVAEEPKVEKVKKDKTVKKDKKKNKKSSSQDNSVSITKKTKSKVKEED